jgi:4-hydroxy-tetrahydrodipicolinate reductase
MGQALIDAVLTAADLTLAAAFDVAGAPAIGHDAGARCGRVSGVVVGADVDAAARAADVLIDFTRPEGTLAHLGACARHGTAAVVGTTGLADAQKAELAAFGATIPIVFAPNMSVGVNVLLDLVETAARRLGPDFDIEVLEMHHRHKVDAPSGTALALGAAAAAGAGRALADCAVYAREGVTGERKPGTIGFATLRGGDVVGDHTVIFAGAGERLELAHRAGSRQNFAAGALRAARTMTGARPHPFDLTGRRALVTGASAGLGLAIAQGLARAGAHVVLNGRDAGRLADAAAGLRDEGLAVATSAFDVADPAATTRAIDALLATHGPLDIVVNNAAVVQRQPLDAFSDDEWRALFAVNVDGPFHVARCVLPEMKARGRGKLINICSLASEIGRPNIVPYAATKGALQMFTRALAVELAPFGIQVNGIAPGFFATAMNAALIADREADAWVRRRTPAGRWGEPAEVAGAAVFLASDAASYVTGHVLFVDGGFSVAY